LHPVELLLPDLDLVLDVDKFPDLLMLEVVEFLYIRFKELDVQTVLPCEELVQDDLDTLATLRVTLADLAQVGLAFTDAGCGEQFISFPFILISRYFLIKHSNFSL
jgi:hypothetical protein